ncbi:DUF87 domain-containing protein [Nostocaceae cyanobacterium CENA357]|uniref:DUF87 domain-containing protein n=1 Tax=Atlanticothrix silvestris CENA357 TaxID=1725252 RepID=A0A8J7HH06_9CYAN|nr:DUF87 domain-containing protein [Atlanticothrix silvestris CENA357]
MQELLSYVLNYREDLQLQYKWEDEDSNRPKLIVETQRRFIQQLAHFEKQGHFYEAINRLKDLNIFEDRRFHKRGKDYWYFALRLWSKDQQINLREFDKEWQHRKTDKSKKLEHKKQLQLKKTNATDDGYQSVFSRVDNIHQRSFAIGTEIDTNRIIYLDLDSILQNSIGVFGNSGTGKTFLTRLLLSGLIHQQASVNLIFDLHSEYGRETALQNQQFSTAKGLRHLFPNEVEIYVTDTESVLCQGVLDIQEFYLSYDQIELEDIKLVSHELGISEDNLDNANILYTEFGKSWITQLLNMTNDEIQIFCQDKRGDKDSIMALQRKLLRLDTLKNMRAVVPQNYINQILRSLEAGKNVVVEFSPQSDMLCYVLLANMICRRIHSYYVKKTEKFWHTKNQNDAPRRLVITIEDAHYLLNSNTVRHTIFHTLIRQSWKLYITLFVVERYPSRIDKEVMSELGTRMTGFLNPEDIDAIFTDVAGNQSLRSMMSRLNSSQQALIFGYGIAAPVVLQTRSYDEKFYDQISNRWSSI